MPDLLPMPSAPAPGAAPHPAPPPMGNPLDAHPGGLLGDPGEAGKQGPAGRPVDAANNLHRPWGHSNPNPIPSPNELQSSNGAPANPLQHLPVPGGLPEPQFSQDGSSQFTTGGIIDQPYSQQPGMSGGPGEASVGHGNLIPPPGEMIGGPPMPGSQGASQTPGAGQPSTPILPPPPAGGAPGADGLPAPAFQQPGGAAGATPPAQSGTTPPAGQPTNPFAQVQEQAQQHLQRFLQSGGDMASVASQGVQSVQQSLGSLMQGNSPIAGAAQGMLNGQPAPPAVVNQGVQNLTNQGHDPRTAMQIVQQMDPGQQLLMAAGLGIGAVGLISALAGGGGTMSFVMAALGLGTAAGVGANAGLLGQGPQQFMQGILHQGQGQSPPAAGGGRGPAVNPRAIGPAVQALTRSQDMSPDAWRGVLGLVPPEMAGSLDQAIGHGGMGNQLASWYGQLTNTTGRQLAEMGITDPQAQQQFLNHWRAFRGAKPVGAGQH